MSDREPPKGIEAQRDDLDRAIGRYLVTFSALIYMMRRGAAGRISPGSVQLGHLALGEANAAYIARVFFGLCEEATQFDESERNIESHLRKRTTKAYEERNFIAHGDWLIRENQDATEMLDPFLARFRSVRADGHIEFTIRTAKSLDESAEAILTLHRDVEDFGRICLKTATLPAGFRVSDLFELYRETKRGPFELRRTGPRASEFPPL